MLPISLMAAANRPAKGADDLGGQREGTAAAPCKRGVRDGPAEEDHEAPSAEDESCPEDDPPDEWEENLPPEAAGQAAQLTVSADWAMQPEHGNSRPTIVRVQITLEGIHEINSASCKAHVTARVDAFWHDPRLRRVSEGEERGGYAPKQGGAGLPRNLWSPGPIFVEADDPGGRVAAFARPHTFALPGDLFTTTCYTGLIKNVMPLTDFPFDTDIIDMTFQFGQSALQSGQHILNDKNDCRAVLDKIAIPGDLGAALHDWRVVSVVATMAERSDDRHDEIKLQVHVARRTSYYVKKVMAPLALITILNVMCLLLPVELLSERLAHITSLFLASMAFMYVIDGELPRTPFFTAIDRMIFVNYTVIMVTALHVCAEFLLEVEYSRDRALKTVAAYCAAYACTVAYVLVPLSCKKCLDTRALLKGQVRRPQDRGRTLIAAAESCKGMLDVYRYPMEQGVPEWLRRRSRHTSVRTSTYEKPGAKLSLAGSWEPALLDQWSDPPLPGDGPSPAKTCDAMGGWAWRTSRTCGFGCSVPGGRPGEFYSLYVPTTPEDCQDMQCIRFYYGKEIVMADGTLRTSYGAVGRPEVVEYWKLVRPSCLRNPEAVAF